MPIPRGSPYGVRSPPLTSSLRPNFPYSIVQMPNLRHALLTFVCALSSAVASAQILIGQTSAFTGPVAAGVQESTRGAKLYFDDVNLSGGVGGQMIELISLDDRFEPAVAADNARKLIEERGVIAMFLTRGTPHTEAVLPLLDKHKVPLVGPSTGAMTFHHPVRKHVFNVRASYQLEAEKAIAHLASTGTSKVALVTVNDTFGADAIAGADRGMKAGKLQPVLVMQFKRAKPDFQQIAPAVVQSGAQAVLFIGSAEAFVDALTAVRKAGSKAQFVTLSNNASDAFVKAIGPAGAGVIVSQVFPNERSISIPLVKEAASMSKLRGGPPVSPAMLEGYAAAKVMVEALRRAGPRPNRASVLAALKDFPRYDLGGLDIVYGPNDHSGLHFTDLAIVGTDGKLRR